MIRKSALKKDYQQRYERLIEDWLSLPLWSSLHAYSTALPLPASYSLLANKFKASIEEIEEAIEGLVELSLLERKGNFYHAKKLIFIIDDFSKEQGLEYFLLKSKLTLSECTPSSLKHGRTYVIASNDHIVEWFNKEYKARMSV